MKVVLVNDQLNAGGAERVLVNIANLLHEKGIDVTVLLYLQASALDHLLNENITVVYLNRKSRFDFSAMRNLKEQVQNADIVHIHSRYNLRYFMFSKYMVNISNTKIVFHEHVPGYDKVTLVMSWLLKKVDAYIAVQESICNWIRDKKLVKKEKVFFLPNVVTRPAKVQSNISSQLGKIIMVANFRRVKNQIFALEVLQALGPHYSLDLYGMIDEQDYYDEVMQSIKEKGLSQQVNIIKGRTDIYEVLPPYEFALHTASKETGPLVLLEYMNVGLPFFTYNTGDVVNKVKQLLPELILEDLEVSQWVQRIHEVCNKERRADLKNHMDVIINMNYTEEKYWESLNAIYTKTLQAV